MNFLTMVKIEFTEIGDPHSTIQIGKFIEFCHTEVSSYAIILKEDGTVTSVSISNIKFLGDFN